MSVGTDYPPELAAAHGRIAAYRAALGRAAYALAVATPYVRGATYDPQPWRRETAAESLETLQDARDIIEAELAVTSQ